MTLKPASYTVRLTTFTTGVLWVYTITMPEHSHAVEGDSWGSIKSLFGDQE